MGGLSSFAVAKRDRQSGVPAIRPDVVSVGYRPEVRAGSWDRRSPALASSDLSHGGRAAARRPDGHIAAGNCHTPSKAGSPQTPPNNHKIHPLFPPRGVLGRPGWPRRAAGGAEAVPEASPACGRGGRAELDATGN